MTGKALAGLLPHSPRPRHWNGGTANAWPAAAVFRPDPDRSGTPSRALGLGSFIAHSAKLTEWGSRRAFRIAGRFAKIPLWPAKGDARLNGAYGAASRVPAILKFCRACTSGSAIRGTRTKAQGAQRDRPGQMFESPPGSMRSDELRPLKADGRSAGSACMRRHLRLGRHVAPGTTEQPAKRIEKPTSPESSGPAESGQPLDPTRCLHHSDEKW